MLSKISLKSLKILFSFIIIFIFSNQTFSNEIKLEIIGNNFTDEEVILSLIQESPSDLSEEYSNYLIKTLNNSQLFEDVTVKIVEKKYVISITEFPNINNIYFNNNERLKDEELIEYTEQLNLLNLNPLIINNFIEEINKLYETFGYNNSNITYTSNIDKESNTAEIYFDINEGEITKINKIYFIGNNIIDNQELRSSIKSKTKTLLNIFANNNYKNFVIQNDLRVINNLYKNLGYIDVNVDYKIEYLQTNRVNIYFNIVEGNEYSISSVKISDEENILESNLKELLDNEVNKSKLLKNNYSLKDINLFKNKISSIILESGLEFFEINTLEKKTNLDVAILYTISSIEPKYTNQINIYGNSRTYDDVIRRELEIAEGDPVYSNQIERIQNKLNSLRLFKSVQVLENEIENNLVDIDITVEEKQTGTVNAGLSIGTLDGLGVVAGLSERNFYGTGRSLNALVNTTDDKTSLVFETTDRLSYENSMDLTYKANFKQQDFSFASSYKLDTFSTGVGISYILNPKLRHNVEIDYVIKDYKVTDKSTVATSIRNSSGESVSFLLSNQLSYNTLNSNIIPKNGRLLSLKNFIESPTSSSNGILKNVVTFKSYTQIEKNIFSLQTRAGNIISLSNNDILTDDKFSLGGRWLRGFDSFGAGPRESRTSYVGGNNLIATKLDYSREVLGNADFPIYLNIFNDYGLIWENKTKPSNSDNSLRSSAGFGIKYYSPIGPIGFTWGFPLIEKDYDIKRMFLFSVGNID